MDARIRGMLLQPRSSREAMVHLLQERDIHDPAILAAMAAVPRELFVPADELDLAYADAALPIARGQTISQPYVIALMLQALQLRADDTVLEIGTGSGYSTAVLSQLVHHVDSLERIPELADTARERLATLGFDGIDIRCADGSLGWPERAPYDAIVVWASAPRVPDALRDQLAVRGRLVLPVGDGHLQHLVVVYRRSADAFETRDLGPVTFVPLIGQQAWS